MGGARCILPEGSRRGAACCEGLRHRKGADSGDLHDGGDTMLEESMKYTPLNATRTPALEQAAGKMR
eukprot:6176283-Pleurochrysis_carterae.AAC.3